jgi:hypothetical protein
MSPTRVPLVVDVPIGAKAPTNPSTGSEAIDVFGAQAAWNAGMIPVLAPYQ